VQTKKASFKEEENVADVTVKMHTRSVIFKEGMVAEITRMTMITLGRNCCQSKRRESESILANFFAVSFLLYFMLFYFISSIFYFISCSFEKAENKVK